MHRHLRLGSPSGVLIGGALSIAAALPFLVTPYHTFQFTQVLIYAIALLGLNLLTGYNGQISLGHGAFYAIGAYVAAIGMDRFAVPYWATLPLAAITCLVIGFLFGLPALRLDGHYLSLATFALGVALPQLLKYKRLEPWTGGVQGIVITKPDAPWGLPLSADQWLYFFTLSVTVVMFALALNLVRGRVGRAMMAIRDQPIAAAAMGVDNPRYKSFTFGVSAMYTGIAGALGAIVVQFVAPDSFTSFLSIMFLIGIIVGGLSTLSGALYGAAFIQFVPNVADSISKAAPWAVFGVVLILCLYVMPTGVAGALARLQTRLGHLAISMNPQKKKFLCIVILCTGVFSHRLSAEKKYGPGVTDTEIKIGNIMPYSGQMSAYGTIGKTEAAYFRMINERGGVNGRKINFISLDGAASPPKTVELARRLVEQDQVLLLFAVLGTAPNVAIQKYLNAKKVPQLLIHTGASRWNDPLHFPWTMGWQPDYQQEARLYAAHILAHTPNARIAILYQNDDYGKDYVKGLRDGLGTHAGMIVAELSFELNSPTVDSQVVQLKGSGADVFFNVSTPKFAAQAIRKAYDIGWRPVQYLNNTARSVGAVIKPAGPEKARGIISSAYMHDPSDLQTATDPAVNAWRAFMTKYYPDGSLDDGFNVSGYTAAEIFVQILKQAGDHLTRENVMKQAASLNNFVPSMVLPGIKLNTSATDYAPIESLQLVKFDGKQWTRLGDLIDLSSPR